MSIIFTALAFPLVPLLPVFRVKSISSSGSFIPIFHAFTATFKPLVLLSSFFSLQDSWLYTDVSSQLRGTLIEELRPATKYKFRVLAEGPAGQSRPSEEILVTTEPQKPSGPPLNLQIQAISSSELAVTWVPPHIDSRNGDIVGYNVGFREER